jgi:hypothetical protein
MPRPLHCLLFAALLAVLPSLAACGNDRPPPRYPPVGVSDEEVVREHLRAEIATAFAAGDFARIDAMASEFIAKRARTPSGLWKLTLVYGGLVQARGPRPKADDDAAWAALHARFDAWDARSPRSPTARIARAELELARAWAYRGAEFSDRVDPAAWEPFNAHVERARVLLEQDKAFAAADPHWYEAMATVMRVQQWDAARYAQFEDEVFAKGQGYYEALFALAVFHRPKWGGSTEEMDAFARRVVEHTRATEGEGMYSRIYWASDDPNLVRIESYPVDWALMKRSMDAVLERYPDQWNLNHFAAIACRAERPEIYQTLLHRIQVTIKDAWPSDVVRANCIAKTTMAGVRT